MVGRFAQAGAQKTVVDQGGNHDGIIVAATAPAAPACPASTTAPANASCRSSPFCRQNDAADRAALAPSRRRRCDPTDTAMKPLILIVEDEPGIADMLQYALATDGFDTL
ncbi:MAG: hypothetical protein JSW36_08135, partial [Burkholderiales bacterium]